MTQDLSKFERMLLALKTLGTHNGTIHERVRQAFTIQVLPILPRDFAEKDREALEALTANLSSLEGMSADAARAMATDLADFCISVILECVNEE